ncbi:uncharacterized protein LOC128081269, partial [Tympanuchus pallidicinctus]|uniref:uncharacterized protein LOC128081269 n=1 Tax=Tympanuchus pallidicinctus TaxID=109042 RepID=UPI0022870FA3
LSVQVSVRLVVPLSIPSSLSVQVSVCPSIHGVPFVRPSVQLSVRLPVPLSICPIVCLSVFMSVCPTVRPPLRGNPSVRPGSLSVRLSATPPLPATGTATPRPSADCFLPPPPQKQQSATAAHVLLSAASLAVPSGPDWRYEEGINGVFLSGDVRATAQGLQVASGGLYLLYGQFAVTCTATSCPPGNVTLQLHRAGSPHPLLAVPLVLPDGSGSGPTRSGLTQAVGQLRPGDVLSFRMVGDIQGDEWQMAQDEREGNFVGLLRIATRG